MRPTWDMICMMIAFIMSLMATCTRLRVGAVLWNPLTKQIVAVAFNGSPRGQPHCIDRGCEVVDGHCVACLHAEDNVFYWAGVSSEGCILYLTHNPCRRCVNKIIQGKVREVVFSTKYGSLEALDILKKAGIPSRSPVTNSQLLHNLWKYIIMGKSH